MTKTRDLSDFLVEGGVLDKPLGTPHIVPGLLYPSYVASGTSNKLLDGTTAHSGAFGTAQSDGRKYYYTNIAGSKPIKDPRIGAHFGSQRHPLNSIQLLEQETATHGKGVYSIDGREWMRYVAQASSPEYGMTNHLDGHHLITSSGTSAVSEFFEIVGYFSDANIIASRHDTATAGHFKWSIDGGSETLNTVIRSTAATPLGARYVDEGSVHNIGCGATLGIHTLKIRNTDSGDSTGQVIRTFGFELIAQDTTSTTTKSQIQIPAQEVVSFGKKFSISAETKHYNPFAFKTDGTTAWTSGNHNGTAWPIGTGSSTKIHTATSLGLAAWISTNYYYPYNGGRVVKWIDADGVIQTSVNMMPPNARSIGNSASLTNATAKANASIANNTYFPTMEAGTVDHSQAEVAKTFHWREFGNGAANGGTGATYYADASMLNAEDDISYYMDDGLTSLSAEDGVAQSQTYLYVENTGHRTITFIGTGISVKMKHTGGGHANDDHRVYIDGVQIIEWDNTGNDTTDHWVHYAQNLPYGTHILRIARLAATSSVPADIEYSFYQPKMPHIPEDACILADYMLMADFVKQTGTGADIRSQISKGVRYCNGSRDHFYGGASAATALEVKSATSPWGLTGGGSPASSDPGIFKLPFFGTTGLSIMEQSNQAHSIKLNDEATTETALDNTGGSQTQADLMSIAESVTLGQTSIETTLITGSYHFFGHLVTSPIHTSHHYQPFETPYLKELIGGDRNMEQTNLVCSPDGKTWDEVTRDTSYIGYHAGFNVGMDSGNIDNHAIQTYVADVYRGNMPSTYGDTPTWNKNFAIAYDRMVCLEDGFYEIYVQCTSVNTDDAGYLEIYWNGISGAATTRGSSDSGERTVVHGFATMPLKRGDYLQWKTTLTIKGDGGWTSRWKAVKIKD